MHSQRAALSPFRPRDLSLQMLDDRQVGRGEGFARARPHAPVELHGAAVRAPRFGSWPSSRSVVASSTSTPASAAVSPARSASRSACWRWLRASWSPPLSRRKRSEHLGSGDRGREVVVPFGELERSFRFRLGGVGSAVALGLRQRQMHACALLRGPRQVPGLGNVAHGLCDVAAERLHAGAHQQRPELEAGVGIR